MDTVVTFGHKCRAELLVMKYVIDPRDQISDISGSEQGRGIRHDLGNSPGSTAHDRTSVLHRLERGEPEAFVDGWVDEGLGALVVPSQQSIISTRHEGDPPADTAGHERLHLALRGLAAAEADQADIARDIW